MIDLADRSRMPLVALFHSDGDVDSFLAIRA